MPALPWKFSPHGGLERKERNGKPVLRQRRGPRVDPKQEGRDYRLRIAGARACAQSSRLRRFCDGWTAREQRLSRESGEGWIDGKESSGRGGVGGRDHDTCAGHAPAEALQGSDRAAPDEI